MSYRYPHPDDSDEGDFAASVQPSVQSTSQPIEAHVEADDDSDEDVYEAATGGSEVQYYVVHEGDEEDDEDEDEEEDEFHDAEDGKSDSDEEEDEDDDEEEDEDGNEEEDEDDDEEDEQFPDGTAETRPTLIGGLLERIRPGYLTRRQLFALLHGHDLGDILFNNEFDEQQGNLRRREPPDPDRFPKVPSAEGRNLMDSGVFGSTDRHISPQKRLARRVLDRELGLGDKINQDAIAQGLIPSSEADMIIQYDAPVYCGQFSQDGNFFYSCVKDFKVRMYDTSNPYNWRYYKTVNFPFGQWTLTDAHLSPDNKWLAYTSLQSHVCFAPTDPSDQGDPYTLDLGSGTRETGFGGLRFRGNFAIWSLRFSGDGKELIAGTSDNSVVVYDIESRRVLHNIPAHNEHVNAVCFADPKSPHIIYSGSDDQVIKVWDRRSMGDRREAGAFVGHVEGLTYIDSKGDGRYILSNGKDQTMKLWDLRMAMSTERYTELNPRQHTRHSDYDYRVEDYDMDDWFPHPNDNSVVTFRGHKVKGTLIRCHFSPPGSTNSRYVYSGSHDGNIYVWDMDATLAAKIDVKKATASARPTGRRRYRAQYEDEMWTTCVREPYWHPNAPIIAASSWGGYDMSFGTVTVHSYNESAEDDAEPKMGMKVDERLAALNLA